MPINNEKILTVFAGCSVLLAAVAVGLMIRRELFLSSATRAQQKAQEPVMVKDWESYLAGGHRFGATPNAPVTILEFGDFECPACGDFARGALKVIRAKFPNQVSVVFRNWPLPYHKLAYPSARAAECAGNQGRFEQMHDLLYSKQDSLGIKSFTDFAKESGVSDLQIFESCVSQSGKVPSIEADANAAHAVGGQGTPVVIVNGMMFRGGPDSLRLERLIKEELSKKH